MSWIVYGHEVGQEDVQRYIVGGLIRRDLKVKQCQNQSKEGRGSRFYNVDGPVGFEGGCP